jgi:hypothetical protein
VAVGAAQATPVHHHSLTRSPSRRLNNPHRKNLLLNNPHHSNLPLNLHKAVAAAMVATTMEEVVVVAVPLVLKSAKVTTNSKHAPLLVHG